MRSGPATRSCEGGRGRRRPRLWGRWPRAAARLVGGSRPELVSYLLGGVGMVSHLDQAERLWRRNGLSATYVTRSGEVLAPTGRLSGGRRDSERQGNDQSILGRKRAIRQLEEELAGLRGDVEGAVERLAALQGEIARLSDRRASFGRTHQAHGTAPLTVPKNVESLDR